MNFQNFKVETKKNSSQVLEQETKSKVPVKKSTYSSIRSRGPSADYSLYPKVWQGCENCGEESLHIISKKHKKIRCIVCNFTYQIETKDEL